MKYIGLDIGTTTISGLLIDGDTGKELKKHTIKNITWSNASLPWERLQRPEAIVEICRELLKSLCADLCDVGGIGFTGQMHGIVYVNQAGLACSDLIVWQDERGNREYKDGMTYCQIIEMETGCEVATGYGLVTLYYDTVNQQIPADASCICTIADYVAMRLVGNREPLIHASNAASLGLYDLKKMDFNRVAIETIGLNVKLLPAVSTEECIIGTTESSIPVTIPIGDNQASFLGAVGLGSNTLVNIGTGSQLSILSDVHFENDSLECRPYVSGKFLINGSTLCGGSAYTLLENFYREILEAFGDNADVDLLKMMDAAASKAKASGVALPAIDTRFRGTRKNPELRGSIRELGMENFTPGCFAYATMRGVCEELHSFYGRISEGIPRPQFLAASGNGARNSVIQREILSEVFELPVLIPEHAEEAAYGAALVAIHERERRSWEEIQSLITYI